MKRLRDAPNSEILWSHPHDVRPDWRRSSISEASRVYQLLEITTEMVHDRPQLHLFGNDMHGESVLVRIHDFYPYFYVALNDTDVEMLRTTIEHVTRQDLKSRDQSFAQLVLSAERVSKRIAWYYHPHDTPFAKITFCSPSVLVTARTALLRLGYTLFDADVALHERFLIDSGLRGCAWFELSSSATPILTMGITTSRAFDATIAHLIVHPPSEQWMQIAPLRVLSFDMECAAQKGKFPDAKIDPIIQISAILTRFNDPEHPIATILFGWRTIDPILGADVRCFETETDMLMAFCHFIKVSDPDLITGYNINNFDFPYLIDRCHYLKCPDALRFGRLESAMVRYKEATFQSKAVGKREEREIFVRGRVVFDAMKIIQSSTTLKLRSYTLNAVSAHILKDAKEDLHHSLITLLFNGDSADRRRIATYCIHDSRLPLHLLEKLMAIVNQIEMARVTGVTLNYLMMRGQMVRSVSCIYHQANSENMVIPFRERKPRVATDDVGYEGAIVIDPVTGFYTQPVATLDFNSLYPSIMMAHNLCITSLRDPNGVYDDSVRWNTTPTGEQFVDASVFSGLVPRIEAALLAARKKAKEDLKNETDAFKKAVLDSRQLALKVVCNTLYGFFGALMSKMYCVEIASSVTAFGREMILKTRECVLKRYAQANGYAHDSEVIYGDSVPGDTPVIVRRNGLIGTRRIDELVDYEHEWRLWRLSGGKEQAPTEFEAWTEKGWTPIRRVIRHWIPAEKELVTVVTRAGIVVATRHHGFVRADGARIPASELKVGMKLLTAPFPTLQKGEKWDSEDRIGGCWFETYPDIGTGDTEVLTTGMDYDENGLFTLLSHSAQHTTQMTHFYDWECHLRHPGIRFQDFPLLDASLDGEILEIEDYPHGGMWVYDLETENHHFQAGLGRLIVHNTDSVMIRFGVDSVSEAMRLGTEAAEFVTAQFKRPIKIEFEKVYCPYLLLQKKRYAGLYWTKPTKYDYLDAKGIESKRRNNCPLVVRMVDSVLQKILVEQRPRDAIGLIQRAIADLWQNKTDLSLLIVSTGIQKELREYKTKLAQVVVAEKMMQRDPGTAPTPGTRFGIVYTHRAKGENKGVAAEDPLWVLKHGIPIDPEIYLEMVRKPLERILVAFPDVNVKELFETGEHTRIVVQSSLPKTAALARFVGKRTACAGCRVPLASENEVLCAHCRPFEAEIRVMAAQKANETGRAAHTAWTNCHRCKGSYLSAVQCANTECKVFYARSKAQFDADEAEKTLQRFEKISDW